MVRALLTQSKPLASQFENLAAVMARLVLVEMTESTAPKPQFSEWMQRVRSYSEEHNVKRTEVKRQPPSCFLCGVGVGDTFAKVLLLGWELTKKYSKM